MKAGNGFFEKKQTHGHGRGCRWRTNGLGSFSFSSWRGSVYIASVTNRRTERDVELVPVSFQIDQCRSPPTLLGVDDCFRLTIYMRECSYFSRIKDNARFPCPRLQEGYGLWAYEMDKQTAAATGDGARTSPSGGDGGWGRAAGQRRRHPGQEFPRLASSFIDPLLLGCLTHAERHRIEDAPARGTQGPGRGS
jgi:hypothetical protein